MDILKISIMIAVPNYCILFVYSLLTKNYYAAYLMLFFALVFPITADKICNYLIEEDGRKE